MGWIRRLRNTLFDPGLDDEFRAEARAHFDELVRASIRSGATKEAAEREAPRHVGNLSRAQDDTRDVDVLRWLDELGRDVRQAVRQLRRVPGFALAAILVL